MNLNKKTFILAALLVVFGICTPWNSLKQTYLPTPSTQLAENTFIEANTIHVVAKAYTAEQSKKFLKRDLLGKGVQPVQITIQNNSREEFSLSTGSVDLTTVDAKKIAKKLMYSAIPRNIALRVASLFFWPMSIPTTIDTIITLKTHKIIKNDLESKTIKKEVVAPYSIYNRIVFVPEDEFKDSFDITLIELHSLKPKVVHIEGLHKGGVAEAYSDVDPVDSPSEAPSQGDQE